MAPHEYTEEDLVVKRYSELLKISKAFGVKTSKRLKTDKLIEAILKYQHEAAAAAVCLSQDAEAVVAALEGATQPQPPQPQPQPPQDEELLLDIEFPESNTSQESLENTEPNEEAVDASLSTEQKERRRRSGTYDLEEKEEECSDEGKKKKKQRSSTFDLGKEEEGGEGKKMQRSSTFDLATSNDVTLPIDEKQTEENTRQLRALHDKVTLRASRRNGVPGKTSSQQAPEAQGRRASAKPSSKEASSKLSGSSKRRRSQTEPVTREPTAASPWQSRVSLSSSAKRWRRSVTVTPSVPAPPLRPSLQQRRSRGTPGALTKATTSTTTTTTTTSAAPKPVFTIGCGDKKDGSEGSQDDKQGAQGKGSSGIPRFMSYARRLKMPNFARIHEQAFGRMDSLDDYVDKRKARQDTLGSTAKKKQDKAKVFQPSITTIQNLNFNFIEESPSKEGTETHTVDKANNNHTQATSSSESQDSLPKLPSPKTGKKGTNSPRNTRVSRRVTRDATKPANVTSSPSKRVTRKSPRLLSKLSPKPPVKTSPKSSRKEAVKPSLKASPKTERDVNPAAGQRVKALPRPMSSKKISSVTFPAFGSNLKENRKPGKPSLATPMASKEKASSDVPSPSSVRKRMQEYSKKLATSGPVYVPYKGVVKPLKSRENLKILAQRKHNVKSSKEIREGRRNILKGVRINKRFELQMANRGIAL